MTTTQSNERIIRQHLEKLQQGDLYGVMADFDDDAILVMATGVIKGKAAIEEVFAGFLAGIIPPEKTTWTVDQLLVEGDVGYLVWSAKSNSHEISFASDSFFLQEGKIKAQTSAGIIQDLMY
ncbi:nuclear transport factor 2 family protein [Shewanella corallii]|uniref:Nuclear transport factor 2 family protein n=1 Tax=Shewanella corallii TaxID=560080 RepID=A0ABT0NAK9_9GAMM|nr:nuclear transport factor 2 family protein [Shewanella corallii]MCL2915488.1 nuclear transport factor 2 family protein [Shewanella corallii]